MANVYKLSLSLERNGVLLPGYPKVKRLSMDESQGFDYEKADDADAITFSAIPAAQLSEIQLLVLAPDKQVTFRFDGQTDAGVVVNAGGLIVLVDVDIDAGAGASNASVNNNSGSVAKITGVAGGT